MKLICDYEASEKYQLFFVVFVRKVDICLLICRPLHLGHLNFPFSYSANDI
jgi:hypothetical protein